MDKYYNSLLNLLGTSKMPDSDLLKIGNLLSAINQDTVEIPKLVVVGTQSSGKSTLLNAILGMDIMPTGSCMVTRTPLNLQLINDKTQRQAEFGYYNNAEWIPETIIKLDNPVTNTQISTIRKTIEKETNKKAGSIKNISFSEIILKIISPDVPALSLIDLPGLTMVACTDQGQPKDIKDQISKLIGSYIKSDRSVIIAVLPARSDLETDPALELIKQYDPVGARTVGVLTKVDLMNQSTDISNYITGDISNDLKFKYGYYAVRNRSTHEIDIECKTVADGYKIEHEYFANHPVYSKLKKLGVKVLSDSLSNILIDQISVYLPIVLKELTEKRVAIQEKLDSLGSQIINENDKITFIHVLLSEFTKEFNKNIHERGNYHSGRKIKEILSAYREENNKLSIIDIPDEYLINLFKNHDGNHMSTGVFPIEVLEYCLKDPEYTPLKLLGAPAVACNDKITILILETITEILNNNQKLLRFPKLVKKLQEIIKNDIIFPNQSKTQKRIIELVELEQYYTWTENTKFNEILNQSYQDFKINKINTGIIKKLINAYFDTVKYNFSDQIPKIIMYHNIKEVSENLYINLCDRIKINAELFEEDSHKIKMRTDLIKTRDSIVASIEIIKKMH